MSVQRIAHLEAQRVARAHATRYDAMLTMRQDPVPEIACAIGRAHQLHANLAGIARTRHEARHAGDHTCDCRERLDRVGTRCLLRPDVGKQLECDRALQRDHGRLVALVGHDGAALLEPLEVRQVGRDVAGVDHQQPDLVGQLVDDQIVDYATLLVEQERILRLPFLEAVDIAGERLAQQILGSGAGYLELTHMRDIKDAGAGADGAMLLIDADVVDRHLPAAKLDHACAEFLVAVVQRCAAKAARHGSAKRVTVRGVPIAYELHYRHNTAFRPHMRDRCGNVTVALRIAVATPVPPMAV